MFGGKVVADFVSQAEITIVTVQPGSFKAGEPDGIEAGSIESRTVSFSPHRSRTRGTKCADIGHSGLEEAEAIVAAGRGIGNEESVHLIERLASLLPRSAIAGSRPVCDAGWLEYKQQVGMTGATVSPNLYIACGISGSVQHLCGMRGAEFIVAINKDPNAAIFNESDVCVVEDLATFLPTLIDRLERWPATGDQDHVTRTGGE
jgi:electron transfer flavoprotein alpha subunit